MATALSHTQYIEVLDAGADAADPGRLGGKGASLCRLMNLGHRVPAGFVITREAFQAALKEMGLTPALDNASKQIAAPAHAITKALTTGKMVTSRLAPSGCFISRPA